MKIEKLRKELSERGLEAFVSRQNAQYLAETRAAGIVVVTLDDAILLSSRLNLDRAKRESEIEDIRGYAKAETPLREEEKVVFGELGEVIGSVLNELEVSKIGHDGLGEETLEKIKEKHEAEYDRESELLQELRKTKTEEEIENLRKAGELVSRGMKKAREVIELGRTEIEVAAEIEYEMRKSGSGGTPFETIVASGENSWLPHTEASVRKIGEGEVVVVDIGARWNGYNSDMTRTFPVSSTGEQKELLEISRRAQEKSLEKVEAGVKTEEVEEAAREVFRKSNHEKYYLHGAGHGVGLDIHEPPRIGLESEEELEENMVITIEPGIYLEGVGGFRFEDMVLVEENGCEKLTSIQ